MTTVFFYGWKGNTCYQITYLKYFVLLTLLDEEPALNCINHLLLEILLCHIKKVVQQLF